MSATQTPHRGGDPGPGSGAAGSGRNSASGSRGPAPKGMSTVALRNISAHKLRMVLSVLAVVLGTAFISASFTFTSTLQNSFDNILGSQAEGLDAVVQPKENNEVGIPLADVEKIEQVPGVASAQPALEGNVVLIKPDGKPVQTGGAPMSGQAWHDPATVVGDQYQLEQGAAPSAPGQIALDTATVEKYGYTVGEPVQVYVPSTGTVDLTLTGTYSREISTGGYIGVFFDPGQAAELFTDGSHVPAIRVGGDGTVDQEALAAAIAQVEPDADVQTGAAWAQDQSDQLKQGFSFLNYFFLAFGAIGLLVGTFIIFNTFSMLVAQRLRELALLRAIGAGSGQVVRSVLVEAAITGLVGSILGVLAGFAVAFGLFSLMDALGFGLPGSGLAVTSSAVIVPLVVGLVVTVISALVPAWRAGRVPPVAAMRSGPSASGASNSSKAVTAIGAVGLLGGIALAIVGSRQDTASTGAALVGPGALLVIVCAFLVMPRLSPIVAGGIGRVIGSPFGSMGKLAATNSGRNRWRTAATAFSLTLGLALVAAFGTFAASTKESVAEAFSSGVHSDLVVQGASGQGMPTPLPPSIYDKVAHVDGVSSATAISYAAAKTPNKGTVAVVGIDGPVESALEAKPVEGDVQPRPDSAVVNESTAETNGWKVGEDISFFDAAGGEITVPLTGIYENTDTMSGLVVGTQTFDKLVPVPLQTVQMVFVEAGDGQDVGQLEERISDAIADNPIATVQTIDELIKQQSGMIDQLLNIIYALLALALIIAVLGIINTLALSVIERRTELGMLRAIGTQRRQIRTMITLESTQIAIFGALVGAAIGTFLGWAFVSAMSSEGISSVAIPWGTIVVVLVAAGVVGVLAALWPAYRAARTSPLEAIAEG